MTSRKNICAKCKLKEKCGDLPGFCLFIYYVPIVLLVIMLLYFLLTMEL